MKNYCISSILQPLTEKFDCVQVTINSRTYPTTRHTAEHVSEFLRTNPDTDLIVHGDYIYECITRFAMFSESLQQSILSELVSIMNSTTPHLRGIVMHTDFPIAKEVRKLTDSADITAHYKSAIWDSAKIASYSYDWSQIFYDSIELLYQRLKSSLIIPNHCKIFLENTVSLGPSREGSVDCLEYLLNANPKYKEFFGLCIDTEHAFAAGDEVLPTLIERVTNLQVYNDVSVMVHVNTIPEGVAQGSFKDKHSFTTIFECSIYPLAIYNYAMCCLDSLNIPWVREVKEETRVREINQIKEYNGL